MRCAKDGDAPLNYTKMLNRVLPKEIRVIAWCPVNQNFSARFECIQRTYVYFFPKSNLDIDVCFFFQEIYVVYFKVLFKKLQKEGFV